MERQKLKIHHCQHRLKEQLCKLRERKLRYSLTLRARWNSSNLIRMDVQARVEYRPFFHFRDQLPERLFCF